MYGIQQEGTRRIVSYDYVKTIINKNHVYQNP